jgi:hypothetical protein
MARITKINPITNMPRTIDIPQYDADDFERRIYAYKNSGADLDIVLPLLTDRQRFFIQMGMTVEEYEATVEGRL